MEENKYLKILFKSIFRNEKDLNFYYKRVYYVLRKIGILSIKL